MRDNIGRPLTQRQRRVVAQLERALKACAREGITIFQAADVTQCHNGNPGVSSFGGYLDDGEWWPILVPGLDIDAGDW